MQEKLISIIIPVYNCENTITRCIESIINQTYTNLEIILVDDGSKDRSGAICDNYAKKDFRIQVIHKPNGGASSARNCGLEVCRGEYIGFVDSDDYIEKTMYEDLLTNMIEQNASISVCGYRLVYEDKTEDAAYHEQEKTITREQLLSDIFHYKFMGVLWNKLFEKRLFILKDGTIRFREDIHLCEDVLILTQLVRTCSRIAVNDRILYNYFISSSSLCHRRYDEKKLSILQALNAIVDECRINFPDLLKSANYFSATLKSTAILDLYHNKKENKSQIVLIKKQLKKQCKESDFKTRLRIILIIFFPVLYKKLRKANVS